MDLGDVLECSICLEQLSESNKVLPCQHTFCTKCLQDVFAKKQELLCPECRTKVTVDISTLPPNILVNRLLEGLKQSRKTSSTTSPANTSKNCQPSDILVPTSYKPNNSASPIYANENTKNLQNPQTSQEKFINPPNSAQNVGNGGKLDDKCLVTFTQLMYQNILPQPVIKERGKDSWSSTVINPPSVLGNTADLSTLTLSPAMTSSLSSQQKLEASVASFLSSPTPSFKCLVSSANPSTNLFSPVISRGVMPTTVAVTQAEVSKPSASAFMSVSGPFTPSGSSISPAALKVPPSSNGPGGTSFSQSMVGSSMFSQKSSSKPMLGGSTPSPALVPSPMGTLTGRNSHIGSNMDLSTSSVGGPSVLPWPASSPMDALRTGSLQRPATAKEAASGLGLAPKPVIATGGRSCDSSPVHALPITGNLKTNPFLEMLESRPSNESADNSGARQIQPKPIKENLPKVLPNSTKEWQLSPRALLDPPGSSNGQHDLSFLNKIGNNAASTVNNGAVKVTVSKQENGSEPLNSRCDSEPWNIGQQRSNKVNNLNKPLSNGQLQSAPQPTLLQPQQSTLNVLSPDQAWTKQAADLGAAATPHRHPASGHQAMGGGQVAHAQKSGVIQGTQLFPTRPKESQHLFKAVYDYTATQRDELSLKKGEVYLVTERCQDGWFRGKNLKTGESGVFPGNHLQRYQADGKDMLNLYDSQPDESDAERLEKLRKIRETLKKTHAQNIARSNSGAAGHVKSRGERYRCVATFPASTEYEIELQVGDVISLVKKREDGWCKGILHRTGKTGLFPASFVERIG